MSCGESPGPPPIAGCTLLQAIEATAVLYTVGSNVPLVGTAIISPTLLITLALTFVFLPPPTKYCTVKVVLDGTSPYALV